MATYSNYRYNVQEAERLADLFGIEQDLSGVVTYCKYVKRNINIARCDYALLEAMGIAAVIRYGRCFASGVRTRLDEKTFTDAEIKAQHQYFIDMRNKHVAHSVNPLEDNAVTVMIGEHFQSSKEIAHVGVSQVVVLPMGHPDFEKLHQLASYVLEKVRGEIAEEKKRLLGLVRNEPIEELRHAGMLTLGPGDLKMNVSKQRNKVRKAR